MNRRVFILDSYYPEALAAFKGRWDALSHADHLASLLHESFGTFDTWSRHLNLFGWEVVDCVANAADLQGKWMREQALPPAFASLPEIAMQQIERFDAHVVILQDVSFLSTAHMDRLHRDGRLIVAQISCPMPNADKVQHLDLCFTSFPHYVERLEHMGVKRVVFMPLAFDPEVLNRIGGESPERDIDLLFVGGVGKTIHWRQGTETLEALARAFEPHFEWWGYGLDWLEPESPLRTCYRGPAFGLDMYRLLLRAKIAVARHGEVALKCGNAMRQYESTGMGSCLLTDYPGAFLPGIDCMVYDSSTDAIEKAKQLLADDELRRKIATSGCVRTLQQHTFAIRMKTVAAELEKAVRV